MDKFHTSVLLEEVINLLRVKQGKKYIDATLGGAGHTLEVLKRGGVVLGIDIDEDAIEYVKENIKYQISNTKYGEQLVLVQGNFKDIDKIAHNFNKVSGIIFDLGVSSHQLDLAERGFSFQKEGPLDMRMTKDLGVKAEDLINALGKGELYELFTKLGEEHFARTISNNIIRARRLKKIETTKELADIIRRSYPALTRRGRPRGFHRIDPATLVFQALRIAVNDELNNLREALPKALSLLEEEGRIIIISFHSLEDRIIKNTFKDFEEKKLGKIITEKPVLSKIEEIEKNPRSRSAKLRAFEKSLKIADQNAENR